MLPWVGEGAIGMGVRWLWGGAQEGGWAGGVCGTPWGAGAIETWRVAVFRCSVRRQETHRWHFSLGAGQAGSWRPGGHHSHDLCLVRFCFLVHKQLSSCCVPTQWKGEGALWSPLYKGTNPIHEASIHPHDPVASRGPHLLKPSRWGQDFTS